MPDLTARVLASFLSLGIGCAARQKTEYNPASPKPNITCTGVKLKAEALESPENIVELTEYRICKDQKRDWTERLNDYSIIDMDQDGRVDIIVGQGSFTASKYPCGEGIYLRNNRKEGDCVLQPLVWERAQGWFERTKPRDEQEDKQKLKFIYDKSI